MILSMAFVGAGLEEVATEKFDSVSNGRADGLPGISQRNGHRRKMSASGVRLPLASVGSRG